MTLAVQGLAAVAHELLLFAAAMFLLGGASDLIIDGIWASRALWRRLVVYRRHRPGEVATLPRPLTPGRIVVFVPAWDEAEVIGPMLRHAAGVLRFADWVIYVGVYPNDAPTAAAVRAVGDPRIRLVVGTRHGPTTKADCLNTLWRAMVADEVATGVRTKAVALHDAEDVVHPDELRVFDSLIERFDLVQLPVLPLVDRGSRWVSGHYIDEFAVHHSRTIVAREVLGAALPSAGVGCAFSRDALGRLVHGDGPFDATSLTEDYELGLNVRGLGGRSAFVRLPEVRGGPLVAVRAHFPATLTAAVTQKARWIAGIALSGWDRLGWQGGVAERWMRLNDRRAVLAAIVVVTAYGGVALDLATRLLAWAAGLDLPGTSPAFALLMLVGAAFLVWRLLFRAAMVARLYGPVEGLRAVPRAFLGNVIDVMAARRAVGIYLRARRDGVVRWDKTHHAFPADPFGAR